MSRWFLCLAATFVPYAAFGQDVPPYVVVVKEGPTSQEERILPVDPVQRAFPGHANSVNFGIRVDNIRICCTPQGSIWPICRVDGAMIFPGQPVPGQPFQARQTPLAPGPNNRPRIGFETTWTTPQKIQFTQTVEVVPGRPGAMNPPSEKRQMNACLITTRAENKDVKDHVVELRNNVDILINNNDGALFASPTTHPDRVLNGIELRDKGLPEYLHVLERPEIKNPGFVATMTLKFRGKSEGPHRIVLTQLGVMGINAWDIPAQAAGDSACAVYWEAKTLKPGEKRDMVWGYGGGIASDRDAVGRVRLKVSGSFEPNGVFTVAGLVDDPIPGQSLALELPPGMIRLEGRELQPVAASDDVGHAIVLWRGRVQRTGDFEIRLRSSTGSVHTCQVSVKEGTR